MSKSTAKLSFLRIAPRKVRLLADLVKGSEVSIAINQLTINTKRSAEPLLKLIKSAVANAHENSKVPEGTPLYIRSLRVDEGRTLKRMMPRARGRATTIRKRSSHITLELDTEKK
ncbi:MAG: 50S ribosomal protein L22 [bacterium]|nr:50S ribosomal protein L22 [bacterium]